MTKKILKTISKKILMTATLALSLLIVLLYFLYIGDIKYLHSLNNNCRQNNAKACFELGREYYHDGSSSSDKFSLKFFKRSCEKGYPKGCTVVGIIYYLGEFVERDKVRANYFFQKGCRVGDTDSCFIIGYRKDQGVDTTINKSAAARMFKKACSAGHKISCEYLQNDYLK